MALLLVVLAANLGIAARLYILGTFGQAFFVVTRLWLLGFPLGWFLFIDQGRITWRLPSRRDFTSGLMLGVLMAGVISIAYLSIGKHWLDASIIRAAAETVGLAEPWAYLAFGLYFTFINALIEEYVWRWFVYQKCAVLFDGKLAVYVAALCFTLHHIIALAGYTSNTLVTVIGSTGVFIAGATWSWCFLRYQSLWACYLSHALADLAIALIGWDLLFRS